jgi:competence protein ComEC
MKSKLIFLITSLLFLSFNIYKIHTINLWKNDKFEINFLNAGQGDSILIKTPRNHLILIDTGKEDVALSNLEKVIPYSKFIDVIIITHSDADHFENLTKLINSYDIGTIFINYTKKHNDLILQLKKQLKKENVYGLKFTNDFYIDNVFFDIYWPSSYWAELTQNLTSNNTSISILIKYKNFKIFTAGDLEKQYENLLSSKIGKIDILKISHHGSNTSTSRFFVEKTKPKFSIISAGLNNQYQHPHHETIKNISSANSYVVETSKVGNIKFTIE